MILLAALALLTAPPQQSTTRVFPLRSIDTFQLFAALSSHPPTEDPNQLVRARPLPTLFKGPPPGWVSTELRLAGVKSLLPAKLGQAVVATGTPAGLLALQRRIEALDKMLSLNLRLVQDETVLQQTTLSVRQYDQQRISRPTGSPLTLASGYRLQTNEVFLTLQFPNRTFRQTHGPLGTELKLPLPDGQMLFVTATPQ
jgi:hypothetical protein